MDYKFILFQTMLILRAFKEYSGKSLTVLNLPELRSDNSLWQGQATTVLQHSSLSAMTVCGWFKSASLTKTGTLFAHTFGGKLKWGLISMKQDQTDHQKNLNHYVRVVIAEKIASSPILLYLNDVVWHYVCMTWNKTGKWVVFKDGKLIGSGNDLGISKEITCFGKTRFGFGFSKQQQNPSHTELLPFSGKITNFVIYNFTLSTEIIKNISNCLNESIVISPNESILQPFYKWTPKKIETLWPADFIPTENICNKDNSVTIECTHNHITISVLRDYFQTSNKKNILHLNDPICTPSMLSGDGKRFIFEFKNFKACGTKQIVSENEVIYSNQVTNFPSQKQVFISRAYRRVEVRCRFPIKLLVSSTNFQHGLLPQFTIHTPINFPGENRKDLEALTLLYKNESFESALERPPLINPQDFFYIGVFLKNKTSPIPVDNVSIAIDSCYVISETLRREFLQESGCKTVDNTTTVLENGRSQARMRLSGRLFKNNIEQNGMHEGAIYLQCFLRACKGTSCATPCGKLPNFYQHRKRRSLFKSIYSKDLLPTISKQYNVTIGPLYLNNKAENHSTLALKKKVLAQEEKSTNLMIIQWITVLVGFLLSFTFFSFLFVLKRSRNEEYIFSASEIGIEICRKKEEEHNAPICSFRK